MKEEFCGEGEGEWVYVSVSGGRESVLIYREKNSFKIKSFILLITLVFHSNTAEGIQPVSIMTLVVKFS